MNATNKGVAIAGGRVIRGTQDGFLYRARRQDRRSAVGAAGCRLEHRRRHRRRADRVERLVYVGKAGGDWGIKGRMMAFNVADGSLAWTFDLIPTGNETGANTWETPGSAEHGGGAAWTTYALDRETGTLFVPVGNPGPDYQQGMRKGANLFTISTVAIDARTGKLKWWYQLRPNDDHDWDNTTVSLFDAGGRKLVATGGKEGILHVIDRETGKLRVQAADDDGAQSRRADHARGRARLPGRRHSMERRRAQPEDRPALRQRDRLVHGVQARPRSEMGGDGAVHRARQRLGHQRSASTNGQGWINAVDPKTGKMAWRVNTADADVRGADAHRRQRAVHRRSARQFPGARRAQWQDALQLRHRRSDRRRRNHLRAERQTVRRGGLRSQRRIDSACTAARRS